MLLASITYLDRVAISVTAVDMRRDLGLSVVQMSWVFSAFVLAYGLFEIPTGWWGDRVGARRILTRIVVWWSTFTVLTGAVVSYLAASADPLPVRRRGSRRMAERGHRVCALDSTERTRDRAGSVLFGRTRGGGPDADPRRDDALLLPLARALPDLRRHRVRVGARVVPVVPRHAARAPAGQRCRARAHRGRHDGPDPPRLLAHALEAPARQSVDRVPVPDVLHRRSTASTSSSPGCRRTSASHAGSRRSNSG